MAVSCASVLEYFVTNLCVSECSFLFEENYFDSRKQLHVRIFAGFFVCVCQTANPGTTSCYMCVSALCVCVCVSTTVTHQSDNTDGCPTQLLNVISVQMY